MAVNDENMLPLRVRKMRQMEDLLQAEQIMLDIIEGIIRDMIQESTFLTAETVTPAFLKKLVAELFRVECDIVEFPENVMIKIRLHIKDKEPDEQLLNIEKTNQYIPAHLKVLYEYVSKHLLKGILYVSQPRADFVSVSYPQETMNSILQEEVILYTAVPMLEYIELNIPVMRGESE